MSPSPFVVESLQTFVDRSPRSLDERRRGLDVAMGRGRHVLPLARAGLTVFGVDRNCAAVAEARERAGREGIDLRAWCADLTRHPLPRERFDLVLVTRYLQRDLFPALRDAVKPGGLVIYETFTVAQRDLGVGPTSADHLLFADELRLAFETFEVLFYQETRLPEAVAQLVARRVKSSGE